MRSDYYSFRRSHFIRVGQSGPSMQAGKIHRAWLTNIIKWNYWHELPVRNNDDLLLYSGENWSLSYKWCDDHVLLKIYYQKFDFHCTTKMEQYTLLFIISVHDYWCTFTRLILVYSKSHWRKTNLMFFVFLVSVSTVSLKEWPLEQVLQMAP